MGKGRLEAFSDGVIAIIITIMVLELKAPHGADFGDLAALLPTFLSYLLSYVYVGIYWNNHHHMFQVAHHVTGKVLWANLHLLFWLSLLPFATAWLGENHFAPNPTMIYGVVLLMSAIAFILLQRQIIAADGADSLLKTAVGKDCKGKASIIGYTAAIAMAHVYPALSQVLYVAVALLWLVPDRRIERLVTGK